ncbi:Rz1-like lysis system protein LysC [Escherichia coli]
MEDSKVTTNVEISCPTSDEASFENEAKRKSIQISERPSDLLSKEGFALYIGKTPRAVAEMAIRQLENALARCASQVKMIKHCQDENDAQTRQPAQGAD